jgi:predicted O-methyltransferase YrrM
LFWRDPSSILLSTAFCIIGGTTFLTREKIMNTMGCAEIITPQDNENKVLYELDNSYEKISRMTAHEREFINALILRNKPGKLLEIGVSAGASSIIMLNAVKNIENAWVYSIDSLDNCDKSPDKKTGYFVENYSGLKRKWELYTGGFAVKFMEKIGNEIDFCLIDTVHTTPGAILDFLVVLPYLKENAIIVFHDIGWHTWNCPDSQWDLTNALLMSAIHGEKIIQGNFTTEDENAGRKTFFPNIGGIKINKESHKHIYELLNILTIKWGYLPKDEEQKELISYLKKHYDPYYIKYLEDIFIYQKKCYHEK